MVEGKLVLGRGDGRGAVIECGWMEDAKDIRIIAIPYDSGHRSLRMGGGPEHLLENGIAEELGGEGREVRTEVLHPENTPLVEVATAFELDSLVATQVREAIAENEFPLVLSGNCNASVGTLAGANPNNLGIVWFDAHADFNTPETTTSGFFDGMCLAIAVGHCWNGMANGVPGFRPVAEENVVLAGAREIDTAEKTRLSASEVKVAGKDSMNREGLTVFAETLDELRGKVERVYVHIDPDVLDPETVGRANEFAPEGGLGTQELEAALDMIRERFTIAAAGIASYDPAFDEDGRVLQTSIACARTLTS